jgi:hypothetical protein
MFQTIVVEKIKTRILCSITFFENRAVYGTMRRHAAMPDRPQKAIWRMSIGCCITKAKNTNSQYIILIALLLQKWFHEPILPILHYTYVASLLSIVICGTDTDNIFSVLRKTLKHTFQTRWSTHSKHSHITAFLNWHDTEIWQQYTANAPNVLQPCQYL